jgi:hypothetical protein
MELFYDEIQRAPELLSYIQSIVDTKNIKGTFILTGSSSRYSSIKLCLNLLLEELLYGNTSTNEHRRDSKRRIQFIT